MKRELINNNKQMELKSSFFEKSLITKTESYITDKISLFSLEYPQIINCIKIEEGKDKMTDLNDQIIKDKIIPSKNDIRDITALFKQSVALYENDYTYQKIEVKDCAVKIQLKFYDLLMRMLNTNTDLKLFINGDNNMLFLYNNDHFIGAIMALKY